MKEIFLKARRASIPQILGVQHKGVVTMNVSGDGGHWDQCPSCGFQRNLAFFMRSSLWRYKCGCGIQGDAIDLMQLIGGVSPLSAAEMILELWPELTLEEVQVVNKDEQQKALIEVCKRIYYLGHTSVKEVTDWLYEKYGITEQQAINMALDGRMKMMPASQPENMKRMHEWVGQPLLRQSGLWKPENKCPAIAFRQIMIPSRDRRAVEFVSIAENAAPLYYGELSSPMILAENENDLEVLLVHGAKDGFKAIGAGYKGTIWDSPNSKFDNNWLWAHAKAVPGAQFNLSYLPPERAAEIAAALKSRNIAFV